MTLQRKTKKALTIAASLVAIVGVIVLWNISSNAKVVTSLAGKSVTVYRSVTCGCCKNYVAYLKKRGMEVKEELVNDIATTKEENDIPQELSSCHTTLVDDYVVEGHVPTEVIEKLLTEKPAVAGIALPGMPQGSPGMPGAKSESWSIYKLGDDEGALYMTF